MNTSNKAPAGIMSAKIADQLQRADAVAYNMRLLRRVLTAINPDLWRNATDDMVRMRAEQMARFAILGTMDDHDSRAAGELALLVLRDIARG